MRGSRVSSRPKSPPPLPLAETYTALAAPAPAAPTGLVTTRGSSNLPGRFLLPHHPVCRPRVRPAHRREPRGLDRARSRCRSGRRQVPAPPDFEPSLLDQQHRSLAPGLCGGRGRDRCRNLPVSCRANPSSRQPSPSSRGRSARSPANPGQRGRRRLQRPRPPSRLRRPGLSKW